MSLALGIAQGAIKVAQKIFGGFKKRKEKKIARKAQQLLESQTQLTNASKRFGVPGIVADNVDFSQIQSLINPGGGLQAISGAANNLLMLKGNQEAIQPTAANVALEERTLGGPGRVNPMLLIGGAFILILLFITKRGR